MVSQEKNPSTPKKVTPKTRMFAKSMYGNAEAEEKKRNQLIQDHLPLVKSIVGKMFPLLPKSAELEDIYSIGVKGLIVAVNQFDPVKGSSLGAYASYRIRGAIIDELRKLDYLPRGDRAKAKKLQQNIRELELKLGRPCSETEIQDHLGMSKAEYSKLLKDTQPVYLISVNQSVDNSAENGESSSLSDVLEDPNLPDLRDICDRKDDIIILRDKIKQLPDQQKKILVMYYYEEMKLSEIAVVFGLTEARISQILSHTILSLKSFFAKN